MNEGTKTSSGQRAQTRNSVALVLMLTGALLVGVLVGWAAFSPVDNRGSGPVVTVPQSCLDALDAGDQGFTYAADALDAASRGLFAAAEYDIRGMEAAADDVGVAGDGLRSVKDDWNGNKADCRAAAR